MLVCVMALSVSVPLRTFLSQQAELDAQDRQQVALTREVAELEQRKAQLSDPAHIEAEARERLGYVRPGETPYTVHLPEETGAGPAEPPEPGAGDAPWYERLWQSVVGKDE
nr:septum formation initiator family protein [Saccharopolyspora sp. HNM0983]